MKLIKTALSNEVFDGGDHIQKHEIYNGFKTILGGDELEIIDAFDSQLQILHEDDGWFALTKLEGQTLMIYTDEQVKLIAEEVKYFSNTKVEGVGISNFEKAYEFLGGKRDISREMKILKKDPVLLHNDLVEGNILVEDKDIHLIDFEYSGYGNKLFDIASFIIERKLRDGQEELWISQFEDVNRNELELIKKFLSEFWMLWARYMFESTSLEIYQTIEKWHNKNAQ